MKVGVVYSHTVRLLGSAWGSVCFFSVLVVVVIGITILRADGIPSEVDAFNYLSQRGFSEVKTVYIGLADQECQEEIFWGLKYTHQGLFAAVNKDGIKQMVSLCISPYGFGKEAASPDPLFTEIK